MAWKKCLELHRVTCGSKTDKFHVWQESKRESCIGVITWTPTLREQQLSASSWRTDQAFFHSNEEWHTQFFPLPVAKGHNTPVKKRRLMLINVGFNTHQCALQIRCSTLSQQTSHTFLIFDAPLFFSFLFYMGYRLNMPFHLRIFTSLCELIPCSRWNFEKC